MGHLLRQLARPFLEPVERRVNAVLDARFGALAAQLDSLERSVAKLDAEGVADVAVVQELRALRRQLDVVRDDVWHSKAVNLGERLLVGARQGLVFYVEAGDRLIGPRFVIDGEYEPATTAFLGQLVDETSVCIDVGANFGYYTCLLARQCWRGRVLSFEPDPRVHALLQDNVSINWCERVVDARNAAVGDHDGELTLYRRVGRSGNTSIIESTPEELEVFREPASEAFTVPCVTLDALADQLERVDVVKIDVEGAESLVVAGMAELVRRHRPTIVMEWSPWQTERAGFDGVQLSADLAALGLVPHVLRPDGRPIAISHAELPGLTFQNIVLTPA
jgi:FkbM family methyltransferase